MTNVLEMRGLGKRFGNHWAIQDLNLSLQEAQVWGILGPNGSGKTTTLAMILGCLRPSAGSFSWFGRGSADHLRKQVGAILERPYFYPHLSAYTNLNLLSIARNIKDRATEIARVLMLVGLWEHRDQKTSEYSLGMNQRLAFAAALMGSPKVVVLDEPTNGLDAQGIALVREAIRDFCRQGGSVLLASHILDEVEKVCTHVAILDKGKLLQGGAINEVLGKDLCVLLRSEDHEKLMNSLGHCPHIRSFSHRDQTIQAIVKEGVKTGELNQYFFSQGVTLSHLTTQHSSLEAHFLNLVKGDSNEHH